MVYNCVALLRVDKGHQGALSSLRRYARECTAQEYRDYALSQVEDGITLLSELGFSLHAPVPPAVQQGGSVEVSQPVADSSPSVGTKGKRSRRLEGKPSTAKKRRGAKAKAVASDQPSSGLDSPSGSLDGLF